MKNVYVNTPVVKRNGRIAAITLFSGLAVLVVGMVFSFAPGEETTLSFTVSMVALLLGFLLSQVGIFYLNRYGRKPRPFEILSNALKGLDSRYRMFHYYKPTPHLLVGPSGVWVLLPQYQSGTVQYNKGRWRQKWGGPFALYMRIFAQEGLGRPELEVTAERDNVQRFLSSLFPDAETIPIFVALVFTHPRATLDIPEDIEAPAFSVKADKLKELVRKKGKGKAMSQDKVEVIRRAILGERDNEPEIEEDEAVEETA
jgi:hypothetical protein